jgi:prepilin-type N-terminal cleavage/methylation domain-containing protein
LKKSPGKPGDFFLAVILNGIMRLSAGASMRKSSPSYQFSGKSSGGFTLIELLVVIAIIGLLASIVLAQLAGARNKGNDAAVKGEMHNIRTASAEEYYLIANSYGQNGAQTGLCTTAVGGSTMWGDATSGMAAVITDLTTKIGGATNEDCGTSATLWSLAANLPSGITWCVDATGKSIGKNSAGVTYSGLTTGAAPAHSVAGAAACN